MKGIEYATVSWHPVTGCTCGCGYCWARRMATRLRGRFGYPAEDPFRPTLHPERLDEPAGWRNRQVVATCFMGDPFDPGVPHNWREQVFVQMRRCTQHTFLLLTKRPVVLSDFARGLPEGWPENVWAGVSVAGHADLWRVPPLRDAKVSHRWLSYEPALGLLSTLDPRAIEWVVAGCMTGPGATPARPDWFRSVRDDCRAAGIPFFLKRVNATTHLLDGREHRELPTEFVP